MKSKKPEVVWTRDDYERELHDAKLMGPKYMPDEFLIDFCRGASGFYYAHFWADARPFFVELWKRINEGKLKIARRKLPTIGCSRQSVNEIVSGRADENRAKAKQAKTGNKVSAVSASTPILTDDEYVHEISEHAWAKLEPLLQSHWDRYRTICQQLAKQFDEASKTPPTGKARAAGAGTN